MRHHCFTWERISLCARSIQSMLNLLQSTYQTSIVTYKKHSNTNTNAKLLTLLIHSFPCIIILNIQTCLIIQNENHAAIPLSLLQNWHSQITYVISSKLVHVFFHFLVSRAHVCPDFFLLPEIMQTMGEVGHLTASTNNESPSTTEPCL